jgi:hypothetical protein
MVMMLLTMTSLNALKKDLNPWRDCGIGRVVFTDAKDSTFAIISNITFDLGTTALTSALSSPDTCAGAKVASAIFIDQTYGKLAEETAVGEGEHLAALYEIMGCNTSSYQSLTQEVRGQFAAYVSNPDYARLSHNDKAQNFYNIVNSTVENKFAQSCSAI